MKTNPKNTNRWIGRTARGALLGLLCFGGVAWGQAETLDEDALFADPLDVFFEDFKEKREHIRTIHARHSHIRKDQSKTSFFLKNFKTFDPVGS